MRRLQLSLNQNRRTSDITIGPGLRSRVNRVIQEANLTPRRVLLISNKRVFSLYGRDVVAGLNKSRFKVFEWLMPEGERYKSFRVLERAVSFLGQHSFERNDLIIGLGGGVVGDLAGFSAAIYLRGVPFIQMPTTLLAQIDSSVGGKTGINLPVGKNMVGAFYQPRAVVIDTETLASLPRRELVAGSCEIVKQALVGGASLFDETVKTLQHAQGDASATQSNEFESLIAAHCDFKASIVANDEQEAITRSDTKSRRILNFGHTTAHALEAVTNYRWFRHGEAVGYGLLVAGEISNRVGLLDGEQLKALRHAVSLCGPLPKANHLDHEKIIRSLQHDKKSVAGEIKWVLLEDIGVPKIVPASQISAKVLRLSLRTGLQTFGRQKDSPTNE